MSLILVQYLLAFVLINISFIYNIHVYNCVNGLRSTSDTYPYRRLSRNYLQMNPGTLQSRETHSNSIIEP